MRRILLISAALLFLGAGCAGKTSTKIPSGADQRGAAVAGNTLGCNEVIKLYTVNDARAAFGGTSWNITKQESKEEALRLNAQMTEAAKRAGFVTEETPEEKEATRAYVELMNERTPECRYELSRNMYTDRSIHDASHPLMVTLTTFNVNSPLVKKLSAKDADLSSIAYEDAPELPMNAYFTINTAVGTRSLDLFRGATALYIGCQDIGESCNRETFLTIAKLLVSRWR